MNSYRQAAGFHSQRIALIIIHFSPLTVLSVPNPKQSATSLKSRGGDKVLGKLNLAVMDVAREGRVRNTWPLGASQHGEIELALEFFPARLLSPEGASSA